MVHRLIVGEDDDEITKILESYIQSGNISFLIGSGASMPAIQVAGNIESEINDLLELGNESEADLRALSFIEDIEDKQIKISIGIGDAESRETQDNYFEFLTAVDRILFERKNIILPRQANIFTTNYDCFGNYLVDVPRDKGLKDG